MRYNTFDDFDSEEYYGGFQKTHKNKPPREKENKRGGCGKKRRREREVRRDLGEAYGEEENIEDLYEYVQPHEPESVSAQEPIAPQESPSTAAKTPPNFTAGPNTHTIRGNVIDYDRVASMEKVEGEYNGKITYGIKFLFLGKKGSFRVAWFNQNMRERDNVFNNEFAFWHKIQINR